MIIKNLKLLNNIHLTKKHPVSLIHFVTNRCNARCSFCFIDFDNPDVFKGELSLDEIEKLSKTLGPSIQNINLTGGEPFARSDLLEIAKIYFKNTLIRSLYVTSNGSLPKRVKAFISGLADEFSNRKLFLSYSIDDFPERHDEIRKIKGLFSCAIESYQIAKSFAPFVESNIQITISPENYQRADLIYEELIRKYQVKSITIVLARDEGIFKLPLAMKNKLLKVYKELTEKLLIDQKTGRIFGFSNSTIQGRVMNRKNEIVYDKVAQTYLDNKFLSYCQAGSLFGVIEANGDIKPCEILDKVVGNLRDFDYNFMSIWDSQSNKINKDWIKDTKCNCSYECAWSFNVLADIKHQPDLLVAALNFN